MASQADFAPELKNLLQRPLIIGASVSANHRGTESPGRQLALRATAPDQICTVARSGKPGRFVIPLLRESDWSERTIVIGIDLLFWDSTLSDPAETIRLFREFLEQVKEKNIPFILGSVPAFFPVMQPSLLAMNAEVQRAQKLYSQCVVFPLDVIFQKILREGAFYHHGKNYRLSELLPDGLHLSKLAGKVLADRLLDECAKLFQ